MNCSVQKRELEKQDIDFPVEMKCNFFNFFIPQVAQKCMNSEIGVIQELCSPQVERKYFQL